MIKNFFVACLIAIAMPALALIPNVPEAAKSNGLNNNDNASEILGGTQLIGSHSGFVQIRGSESNYAATIGHGSSYSGNKLFDHTAAWSALAVFKASSVNGAIVWGSGRREAGNPKAGLVMYVENGTTIRLGNWVKDASPEVTPLLTANVPDATQCYHSYLVTRTDTNVYTLYVDGASVDTQTIASLTHDTTGFQIGRVHGSMPNGLAENGNILLDEIGVWNQALTDEEARLIAAAFPVWPRILSKEIAEGELELSTIKAETQEKEIIELTMTAEDPTIIVDTTFPDITTIKPTFNGILTIKKAQDSISDSEFGEMLAKFFINELQLTNLASASKAIKIKENGTLVVEDGEVVTCNVDYGDNHTLKGIEGSGTLVKTGDGDLRLEKNGEYAINGTTIEIQSGLVTFYKEGSAVMNNPTFIFHEGTKLDNYGWPTVTGTLTLESDADVTILTNTGNGSTGSQNSAQFQGNPSIVKKGEGKIDLMCGALNDAAHNNVITSVLIENGTLSFGGSAGKVIRSVSGAGTLEEAGTGAMTISKIEQETSLKVSAGTLNNECSAGNGSITLARLEIAKDAVYTMKPAIDHITISKAFYLEGDAHKNWYVTLEDGALIATNPRNPMSLAGLEFGNSVVIGKDQSIGSILAKVVKSKNWPRSIESEDERFAKIPFELKYEANSLVIASTFTSELATIPGMDLNAAMYRIYLKDLPAKIEDGDFRVRITAGGTSYMTNVNRVGKLLYAEINPSIQNEAKGAAYQIKVEIGVNDNETNAFVPIKTYDDISLNVRPEATKEGLINEETYRRWDTGEWDTEGEYITLADGYIQIEGKKVSFRPDNANEEAATKLHFSVKFGEAMKLEILNAIADDGQIAGVTLAEDGGAISYAAWNPAIGAYVPVVTSDNKPIDVAAEHLVEVILTKSGIGYVIDGAALMTNDENKSSVFALPKNASIQIAEIDFVGEGAVKSMTADEYSTKLAAYDGVEYDTIESALAAAGNAQTIEVEALWNSSWVPSTNLLNKVITFVGDYKVIPDTTSSTLAENNMVLRPNTDGSYSVISKFLIVTIPDPETIDEKFGVFLESVTTNSMHLGWFYDYKGTNPTLAKATVVYDDDVTINFSTILENNGLLVQREDTSKSFDLKGVTFKKVHYDFEVEAKYIPVIDTEPVASQKTLAKFGVMKQDVARAESAGILDFTTAADGVTFTVGLLDAQGNDITKIVSEQIGEMVEFSTDLRNWVPVGAENVQVIENEDGVKVMFAQQKDTTSGFYRVVIPADK